MAEITKKLLKTQIIIALFVIGLTQAVSFASLYWVSHQQEGYAQFINISGRQRMLSQKLTLLTLEKRSGTLKNDEEFHKLLTLFKNSHQYLINPVNYADQSLPPAIKNHYSGSGALDKQFQIATSSFEKFFLKKGSPQDFSEFSFFIKNDFLKNLDRAVKLFELQSDELADRLKTIQMITLTLGLLSLFGVYFFIFRPLTKDILEAEAKLREAKKIAEDHADFKAMFLANMSHELRTPLNGIIGVTDLMSSSPITEEQKERVMIIEECANTLLSIVNNILDLTKLEMGHLILEEAPFSPRTIFKQQGYIFDYLVRSKGLNFKVQVSEAVPEYLLGDSTRLTQVLNNLVGNAFKFTEDGHIALDASYDGQVLTIKVEDTGIGMTEEQKEKVFMPFTQADLSTTRKYGGTGLGLTITKEIINSMKGELALESKPGQGTTFILKIPFAQTNEPDVESVEKESLGPSIQAHILVIDDNEINCKMLSRLLERIGHTVDYAMNASHAIDLAKNKTYSLIFMDYHMPEINGPELFLKMKEEVQKDLPPTIALTADLMDSTRKRIKEVGMRELVGKPIRKAQLADLIEKYIRS